MPDGAEDRVRRALRNAVTAVEPSPWPSVLVRERAARRRRARRIAAALPVVVAVAACAVVVAAVRHDPVPARPVPPAVSATRPAPPAPDPTGTAGPPRVRVVQSGRPFDIGVGRRMRLEPSQRCVQYGDTAWTCEDIMTGNQPAGTVSSQNVSGQDATAYTPLYIGSGRPTRITLTVEGHTYDTQVVELSGHPGYAVGYVSGPPPRRPGSYPELKIKVYDAAGDVLASLDSPASR